MGSNENTNRLLRQYYPKGIDMSGFSQAKLSAVARQINQTPAEKLQACVATTHLIHTLDVLGNRTAFDDGPEHKRLLYRARFFDRIQTF